MSKLENKLLFLHSHVNDMLKFAEAKNAGLIILNLTTIVGVLQYQQDNLSLYINYLVYYIIVVNFISIFFCLAGNFAQLRFLEKKIKTQPNKNILYFGTIAQMTPIEFYQRLVEDYSLTSVDKKFEIDLSQQIVIVSQITFRKFRLFNIAMFFTLASIPPTILGYLIFNRFFNPNLN